MVARKSFFSRCFPAIGTCSVGRAAHALEAKVYAVDSMYAASSLNRALRNPGFQGIDSPYFVTLHTGYLLIR